MRQVNRKVFRFGELFKYKFDGFIDLYDYEECEQLMEQEDDVVLFSSTGSDPGRPPKHSAPFKSVNLALDGLSGMMKNGQLA